MAEARAELQSSKPSQIETSFSLPFVQDGWHRAFPSTLQWLIIVNLVPFILLQDVIHR